MVKSWCGVEVSVRVIRVRVEIKVRVCENTFSVKRPFGQVYEIRCRDEFSHMYTL